MRQISVKWILKHLYSSLLASRPKNRLQNCLCRSWRILVANRGGNAVFVFELSFEQQVKCFQFRRDTRFSKRNNEKEQRSFVLNTFCPCTGHEWGLPLLAASRCTYSCGPFSPRKRSISRTRNWRVLVRSDPSVQGNVFFSALRLEKQDNLSAVRPSNCHVIRQVTNSDYVAFLSWFLGWGNPVESYDAPCTTSRERDSIAEGDRAFVLR